MDMMVAGENEDENENVAEKSCKEEVQDFFSEYKIQEDKEEKDKIPHETGEVAQLEQTVNEYVEVDLEKNIENISKANLENEHELKAAPPMLNGKTVVRNMQGLDCLSNILGMSSVHFICISGKLQAWNAWQWNAWQWQW